MNSNNNKQTTQEEKAISNEIDDFKAELHSIQSKLVDLYRMAPLSCSDVTHEALREYLNTIKVELELTIEKKNRVLSQIGKQ